MKEVGAHAAIWKNL